MPAMAGFDPAGPPGAARTDLKPQRIGASPSETLVRLQEAVHGQVLGALAVPAALTASAGAAQREGWRQFALTTVKGFAEVLAQELGEKLETNPDSTPACGGDRPAASCSP